MLNTHLKKLVEGADSFAVRIIPRGPWNYRLVWCHLNLSPYQQQGWLASGHFNWSKMPGGPLAIPAPTSSGYLLWDSPGTLSSATLKPVSAANELLASSKTILTFLKGTEKNKNITSPKKSTVLNKISPTNKKRRRKKKKKAWKLKADWSFNNRTFPYFWKFLVWHKNIRSFSGCYNKYHFYTLVMLKPRGLV